MPARFRFQLLPLTGVLLGLTLFGYLGLWQSGKGDRLQAELAQRATRNQLGAQPVSAALVDAQALRDAPIEVRGEFEPQFQTFLDNRQHNGQPGVQVITPLRLEAGNTRILVNRGWIAWPKGVRGVLPEVATPSGPQTVGGLAFVPSSRKFLLMPDRPEASNLWSRLDMARFADLLGSPLQPVVVLQTSDSGDGLVRQWPPPEDRVAMHRGYAFQWFGMAVALLVFYLVANLRRREGK
ncbi:MAG: SURF1 family protein [Rhodoferax sp.]|uniref:SURF1 family protein n=1 Tax=Rhodoferax sp. TaxID=50421 RepID=UPI001B73B195|nr:SURF1 family protein [Rhodoferax sp.]MBP9147878.1 SURF1 family protein [Rhodoferax sp.]MBP9736696.1 SURF1 family protein [Rhodoferax sp.]